MSAPKKRWRVLVSVTDKTGLEKFKPLLDVPGGAEFVSTGGTGKALLGLGIPVTEVSVVTGFPEMMDGRLKTLHPKICGGILGVQDNPEHLTAMKEYDIAAFNIVVVNLYNFSQKPNIEEIDNADSRGRQERQIRGSSYRPRRL